MNLLLRPLVLLIVVSGQPGMASGQSVVPGSEAPAGGPDVEGSFRISNFVYGNVCEHEDDKRDICREERDIRIDGRQTCVWVGEERPCTWFGVQFDFEDKDPDTPIHCRWDRTLPTNEGNYEEIRARGVTHDEFDLEIGPDLTAGHYFHPMYNLWGDVPMPWYVDSFDFRCSYDGEEILHAPFRLVFSSVFNR